MRFNVQKCHVMHPGKENPRSDYQMNGEKLEKTDDERDVGVTISSNLKPAAQCKKAAQTEVQYLDRSTGPFTSGTVIPTCSSIKNMSAHI
jgi:hypothetical protein